MNHIIMLATVEEMLTYPSRNTIAFYFCQVHSAEFPLERSFSYLYTKANIH